MCQPLALSPPRPPPSTLEDIIAEDHEGVVASLHSLFDDFQVVDNERHADRTKLNTVLQQLSTTLRWV